MARSISLLPAWPEQLTSHSDIEAAKSYPGLSVLEVFAAEWGPCLVNRLDWRCCSLISPPSQATEQLISRLIENQDHNLPPIKYFRACCNEEHFSEALHDSCPSFYLFKNGTLHTRLHGVDGPALEKLLAVTTPPMMPVRRVCSAHWHRNRHLPGLGRALCGNYISRHLSIVNISVLGVGGGTFFPGV